MGRLPLSELLANAVTPLVRIRGVEDQPQGIVERMRAYGVPGLQVAVVEGGELAWSAAFGELEAGSGRAVDSSSLFQAASISKPVTALAVLRLVADGALALDEPVNTSLQSWKLPDNEHTARRPVTLRDLLSHTAGTTVHGFPGYPIGAELPTVVQILNGEAPANTMPVRVDIPVATQFRYSGGGTMIVQQLLMDVTGERFPELMRRLVLDPLGMLESTYEQPLPPSLHRRAASAHDDAGLVPGLWHVYPEMAAAGLWTTASDLARFVIAVEGAIAGRADAIIPQELASAMVAPQNGEPVGLGPQLVGSPDDPRWMHSGGNRGFNCRFVGFVRHADGVVVMTNAPFRAAPILNEIIGAVGAWAGWPDFVRSDELALRLATDDLEAFVGDYDVRGVMATVRLAHKGLQISFPFSDPSQMYRVGEREFVLADATRVVFHDAVGAHTATLTQWGTESIATRRPAGTTP